MKGKKEIKELVKDRYGRIASNEDSCCSCCSCDTDPVEQAKSIGYSVQEIINIPEGSAMGLGCGNPTALAGLKSGETVLDLGSGGGVDVFLASRKVGEQGNVIGVDMTTGMVEKARENARKGNYTNVEFRAGEIENLPVEDCSIDVVMSNCVVNLSPDKFATFREVFRVLKPNGRILISDIVIEGELPGDVRRSLDAWTECIAGALEKQEYLNTITKAGFRDVTIVAEHSFYNPEMDDRIAGKVISVQVRAHK
ncbi:MAG TPA: arsenite methyltransferase [Methanosarcinaceae archaeon]|nr:arsenite methyltransferase [Methanosarcinaceae archaeon]